MTKLGTIAVLFDLVNPVVAFGRNLDQSRKHRRNERKTHERPPRTRFNSYRTNRFRARRPRGLDSRCRSWVYEERAQASQRKKLA